MAVAADVHSLTSRRNIGKAADLLQSLVPRAQCFCFYGLDRSCTWSSDGADDFEVNEFVADLHADILIGDHPEAEYVRRTLKSGRTLLVLPVVLDDGTELGFLVVVFSRNVGKSSWFNPSLLADILAPAVAVIGDGLRVDRELREALDHGKDVEKELKLVYDVDEKIHGQSRSHAGLAQLVGQSGRFLGIAYSVLLMPAKRIRISATHSTWKDVRRKALDRYLIDQMLPRLEGKRSPVVFEIPAVEGGVTPADEGYQTLLCPVTDQQGNVEGMLALLGRVNREPFNTAHRRFMSHVVRKVEYVIEKSFDSMTGLMNRSGFEAQMHEAWKSLESDDDAHQVIYFDLDNLQLVNDTFGRKAGDEVIMRFARLLDTDLPRSAVLSRLTGDDFCILLTHADAEQGLKLAHQVREKGQSLRYLEGDKSLQITISIGVAEFNRKSGDEGASVTAARMACEAAKDHGRDRIEVYDDKNHSIIRRHDDMQLVAQIQQTLDSDGFVLLAQPIASLKSNSDVPRYEILLRMKDDDGSAVPSSAFFSAAERYQLMPQVDRWVISKTIASLSDHADLIRDTGAVFSVNLSGQSLTDDGILEFIDEEIAAGGLQGSSLGFEVTESAAVSNLAKAQQFIDDLHERGCSIALDDFGAGLSSFAYLKNFAVDTLKIDGGFIRDISDNRISESMVAAITQVAKVMELETVAEYVENKKTRKLVAELGVHYAQGHAVGKPQPLEDVLAELMVRVEKSTA
ncbi:MAG: EAL domain-containing protein [Gammaproteobacteria bacterium]|jgi:diguanylate cyclase (GGDEF)-like protein|nr:EAL domain-containing protein [Gammaproteobacteria bacterium]